MIAEFLERISLVRFGTPLEIIRVAENQEVNFKHEKFTRDQADSYSLRKTNAEKCENYQNPTTFKSSR